MLDAWDQLGDEDRARVDARVDEAADHATTRVTAELRALLAVDPVTQRGTPLEVVRGAVTEPTAVLAAAGVPAVVRDALDERVAPDDRYDLAPRAFADVDAALGPIQLAWGLAKAAALRTAGSPRPRRR